MKSAAATAEAGRNDPCPCGSGRKFKQCCGSCGAADQARTGRVVLWDDSIAASAALAVSRARGDGGRMLRVGPLSKIGAALDAVAQYSRTGVLVDATGAGRKLAPRRNAVAAERHRLAGTRLIEAGRPAAAIVALHRAVELDAADVGAQHALGLALLRSGRLGEAVAALRLAIALQDDLAAAHRDLALALHGLGRPREAVVAARRAVELAPQAPEGHRQLGTLLDDIGDTVEAARCFLRAAEAAPDDAGGRLDRVRALLLESNFAEAEAQLRQAIALDPENDELYKTLAEILAKRGRFDEAVAACDQALDLNPLQVAAHLTAVRARKCTATDRPRLGRMLAALRDASIGDAHRLFLHFAIGKLLDDLGDCSSAMHHFERGNSIRRRGAVFDRAALAGHLDRLIASFTPAFLAANRALGLEDETPILIVGMPRSGTTLVEQIISSHPAVAAGEELPFWFNRAGSQGLAEAGSMGPERGRALAAEYLSLLGAIGPAAARVTDKQPFNFQQLGLIHLLLPKARVIHCRRNPVDTCLSMYFTYFKGRMPFVGDKADLAFAYRQYARIMDHWRRVLPGDRLIEVDYETLVGDREAVTRRLIAFTGLDWHDACLCPERNERAVSTASLWQARQPVFRSSVERWRRYEPWLGELRRLLPEAEGAQH